MNLWQGLTTERPRISVRVIRPRPERVTLVRQVAQMVRDKREASLDDIQVEGKSREQIQKAMQNAVQRGLLEVVRHRQQPGKHRGRMGSIYRATSQL